MCALIHFSSIGQAELLLVFMTAYYVNYNKFKFMRLRSLTKTIIVKQIFGRK